MTQFGFPMSGFSEMGMSAPAIVRICYGFLAKHLSLLITEFNNESFRMLLSSTIRKQFTFRRWLF